MTLDPTQYTQMKSLVVGTYDRAAPIYDQVGIRQFQHFGQLLIDRLGIEPGAHVLDIATGRGALLFPAAEKVGAHGRVIGIDLAPEMVAETQAEVSRRKLTQVEVQMMDADTITLAEFSFDYVTCGSALFFFDFERALPQFFKVIKPGGRFAASLPYTHHDPAENSRWAWLFELTRAAFPADFQPPESWVMQRRLRQPEQIIHALEAAGFEQVTTEAHTLTLHYRDAEDWWDWEWSQASHMWLEGMSAESLEAFKTGAFENLNQMMTPDGIPMQYGMLFAFGQKPVA